MEKIHKINLFDTNIPIKDSCANIWNPAKRVEYIRPPLLNYDGITVITDELSLYNNSNIKAKYKIAWLFEPEVIKPHAYQNIHLVEDSFDFIYTHDERLLERNAHKYQNMLFGACWIMEADWKIYPKTKNLSMVASNKTFAPGHKLRHQLLSELEQSKFDFDAFGTARKEFPHTATGRLSPFANYRFSIVIENSRVNNYFTDKLVDCFATGTIPIY
jgi:hypothetical protein